MINAAIALILLGQTEPITLAYQPALPTKHSYQLVCEYRDAAQDFSFVTTDELTILVNQKDSRGIYGLDFSVLPKTQRQDGQELPMPGDLKPMVVHANRDRTGALMTLAPDVVDPRSMLRLFRLLSPAYVPMPLEPGDTWQGQVNESLSGDPALETRYKLDAVEGEKKKREAIVSFSFKELSGQNPFRGSGSFRARVEDGTLIRLEAKAVNMTVPGGEGEPVELNVKLEPTVQSKAHGRN